MADTDNITADTAVADAPAAPASGNFDLDALLAEFDAGLKGADQPVDQSDPDLKAAQLERERAVAAHMNAYRDGLQIDARRTELEQHEQYLRAQEDARDEVEAFKQIRGNVDVSDDDLRAFILSRALKEPAINAVWNARRDNPAAYNRMVAKLNLDLQQHQEAQREKFMNQDARVDHHAVALAVRLAGEKVGREPPPDYGKMSDREFAQAKRDLGIYD